MEMSFIHVCCSIMSTMKSSTYPIIKNDLVFILNSLFIIIIIINFYHSLKNRANISSGFIGYGRARFYIGGSRYIR